MVLAGVVGDDHAVGDDHSGCVLMAGKESHRQTGIHGQGLLVGHLREILHGEQILGPVLEYGAVAAIDYQLVGVLGQMGRW